MNSTYKDVFSLKLRPVRLQLYQNAFLQRNIFWGFSLQKQLPEVKNFENFTRNHMCWTLIKTPTQVFSCEICGIFKNIYFEEHLRKTAYNFVMLLLIYRLAIFQEIVDSWFWIMAQYNGRISSTSRHSLQSYTWKSKFIFVE